MKLRGNYTIERIGDESIFISMDNNTMRGFIRTNGSGEIILNMLKTNTTESDIIEQLLSIYDVSREHAVVCVQSLINELRSKGLLEE